MKLLYRSMSLNIVAVYFSCHDFLTWESWKNILNFQVKPFFERAESNYGVWDFFKFVLWFL